MDLTFGALGGLLGLGAASSFAQSAMQYAFSREAQQRQFENQKALNVQQSRLQESINSWNARNIPKLSRKGMEKAGFNPILAINSGSAFTAGGSAQGGSASMASTPPSQDVAGIMNGVSNAYKTFNLDKKLNKAEIENINATTKNTNAKTITEGYNQQLIQSQYLLNQINTELAKKDLSWKDRMYLMQEKTGYLNAAAAHLNAEAQQLNANTAKQHYLLDREMQGYEKDISKRYKEFGQSHPYLRNFDETLSRFIRGSVSYSKK